MVATLPMQTAAAEAIPEPRSSQRRAGAGGVLVRFTAPPIPARRRRPRGGDLAAVAAADKYHRHGK